MGELTLILARTVHAERERYLRARPPAPPARRRSGRWRDHLAAVADRVRTGRSGASRPTAVWLPTHLRRDPAVPVPRPVPELRLRGVALPAVQARSPR